MCTLGSLDALQLSACCSGIALTERFLSLSSRCCEEGAKCCPQCLDGGDREGRMQMESDAWKDSRRGPKGWQRSPGPRCHILSCHRCCPSRSTSPARSAEQVGRNGREFHFAYVEERKHVVPLLKESY